MAPGKSTQAIDIIGVKLAPTVHTAFLATSILGKQVCSIKGVSVMPSQWMGRKLQSITQSLLVLMTTLLQV